MDRGDVVRTLLVGGLMALGGYLAGRNQRDDTLRRERDEARGEAERLRESLEVHGSPPRGATAPPPLEAPPARPAGPETAAAASPGARATAAKPAGSVERPAALDLKEVRTTDEFASRFLALAAGRLAEGPKGHLELLRTIDAVVRDERLQRTMADEREAVRLAYPVIRFAVTHEGEVTDFVETVFRSMADKPSDLEGVDGDTLEVFTEGLGLFLPSTVSPERLETLRGYVRRVLETPPDSLPKGLRSNLGRLKRLLESWAPPRTAQEILAALADLPADPAARREILRQARWLTAEDWARVDVPAVLGSAIAGGDWAALGLLKAAAPTGGTLAALDARVLQAGARLDGSIASAYLSQTGRTSWATARGYFDAWLSAGGGQAAGFAAAVLALHPPPSAEEVRDLVARADVSEENRSRLLRTDGR